MPSRLQTAAKIRKSGIKSSGLQRMADRFETPEEELEFHDNQENAAQPGLPAAPVTTPAPQLAPGGISSPVILR